MKRIIPVFCLAVGSSLCTKAQLYIDNATFYIESGATVTVQGDLISNASIQGPGKILLKGTALQNVNMNNGGAATNAYTIPNLEVDNTANVSLNGNVRVGTSLTFTNGKIQAGSYNFTLANTATATGMADGKFIETNGTGLVQREISGAASNVLLPVGITLGAASLYTPVTLTHSGGTYSSAVLAAQAKPGKSPSAHIRTESYTNVYWPVSTSGVTGGTFSATGTYPTGTSGYTGTETDIYGMTNSGGVWSRTGGTQNTGTKMVGGTLASNTGQLLGMNRFLLLNAGAILQGAYDASTGLMTDKLRNSGAYVVGTLPASNLLPTTDPYRSTPYSGYFAHTDNLTSETVASGVFNDQASPNNNIVDWVFIELRNTATSGNTVLQTRSALLQRDGDIVDIDGVSPIYFKNLDPNNFSIGVRHRNHLGMYTNPSAYSVALNLTPSTALVNFKAATFNTNVNGTAGDAYMNNGTASMLYAGNVSGNLIVRYQGSNGPGAVNLNDRAVLLSDLSNVESNILSGYYRADVNLSRNARYQGSDGPGTLNTNDRAFILAQALANSESTARTEARPL